MYNRYSLGFHNPMKGGYFIMFTRGLYANCTNYIKAVQLNLGVANTQ